MSRELPIYDGDEFVSYPTLATWIAMHWPDDEISARRATALLTQENDDMNLGVQEDYSSLGSLINKEILRYSLRARVTGNVAYQVYVNLVTKGALDINKAVYSVTRWADSMKTSSGRSLPSDPKALGGYFKKYRDAAHLWAAHEIMSDEERIKSLKGEREFESFLLLAYEFQKEFDKAPGFWENPLRIPEVFLRSYPVGSYDVAIPISTDWDERMRREYRASEVRGVKKGRMRRGG